MAVLEEWRGTDFPRDREILIRLDLAARASWDRDRNAWVLSSPLHIEQVLRPREWKPLKSDAT
jgi:hypothetical protein